MKSYTSMSPEGVAALRAALREAAIQDEGFELRLNASDIDNLVRALASAYHNGHDASEWAADFLSSLSSQVDIEFI